MRISSPCPMSWESLTGDDRVRYCGKCRLNVYNLAIMSRGEVEEIVRKTEGRLCGRLYMRGDQTATVRDCDQSRIRRRLRVLLTVAATLLLGATSWVCWTSDQPDLGAPPAWIQALLDWVHPKKQPPPRMLLGEIACPPTNPPKAPPALPE